MQRFKTVIWTCLLAALLVSSGGAVAQAAKSDAGQPGASLFQEMDVNRDGKVTHKEFMAFYEGALTGLQKDGQGNVAVESLSVYYSARFKALDANGDGVITKDEYVAPGIDANKDGKTTLDEWSAFFVAQVKVMDADKDGKVSPGEYNAYCEAYFRAADKDRDGVIVLKEWMSPRNPGKRGADGSAGEAKKIP